MLDINALDFNRILKTSQTGGVGSSGIKEQALKENALFEFGTDKKNISNEEMQKLEEDFLSAANGAGITNPFAQKLPNDSKEEAEKETNIDAIKSLAEEVKNIIQATQSLISDFTKGKEESGIKIGEKDNKDVNSSSNTSTKHSEAKTKQEEAVKKNNELGQLIKEVENQDIQIASNSTCGEQGEVPDIKSDSQKTSQVKLDTDKKTNNGEAENTPNKISNKQIELLSRLFPGIDATPMGEMDQFKDIHNKGVEDLNVCIELLSSNQNNSQSKEENSSYIQKQKALFLGLSQ